MAEERVVRLDLGGNVFHFVCDHTEFFDLKDVTIENGTIKTGMDASEFCLRGDCIATNNVTFDVGSKFVFLGNAALATCSTGGTTAHAHSLLKFADNATIRVNVGNRPLHKGDYLVTWTAESKPTNLNTVKFKCTGGRSFRVAVDEDGEGTDGLRFIPSGFLMIVK